MLNTDKRLSDNLQQTNESMFQTLFAFLPDAAVIIDPHDPSNTWPIIDCNTAACLMSGYRREELIGQPIDTVNVPSDTPLDRSGYLKQLRENRSLKYEALHRHKNGTVFPVEVSTALVKIGERELVIGIDRDISERKQAEAVLHDNEEKLRAIYEGTNDAVMLLNEKGFFDCNSQTLKMFGFATKEEFTRTQPSAASPAFQPDGRDSVSASQEHIQTAFRQGYDRFEWVHRRHTGEDFSAEVLLSAFDFSGQQVLQATVRDISGRKQAEQARQESQWLLKLVMDNIPQAVFWKDKNLTYLGANQAFAEDAGFASPDDLVGKTDFDMPWREQAELYRADDQRVLDNGEGKLNYEEPQTGPTGVTTWLRTSKIPMRNADGEIFAVLGMYEDITQRKQAEEAVRASQGQLLNIIDFLPDATLVTDKDRKVIAWNRAIEEMTGVKKEDILGRGDYAYSVPFYGEARPMLVDFALEHGQVADRYTELQQQGNRLSAEVYVASVYQGRGGYLLAIAAPLYDADGNVIGAIEAIRDVTERKKLGDQIREAFERRGRQVQLSTQVSQSIASASSLAELYERVVTQVKEQFGYYHTQLLRYDPARDAVVLVTGYGEIGAKMLAAGHRLPLGEGLIGTAAATGETILRPSLENDPDWHSNPLLPETRGEIAVPIRLGDVILGVLDVQSDMTGALDADDQLLLEGLCGQVATAIESTRLRQEMGERLEEINRLYRAMSREGWKAYRETAEALSGFMFDQDGLLKPAADPGLAEEFFASAPLTVPGGEVIGALAIADDPQRPISAEDETFLQQVSEQVALALESARLFEQSEKRAHEMETVAEVSTTTATLLDPDRLLYAVVDLTKERFGLYHAHLYLADANWQTLLLAAGAGEVGRKMVAEGHTLALTTERSIVVRAARERQAVIVNDVRSEPDFLPHPLLPETRSEMAVPMIVGDKVLGVFDVQSKRQNGFGPEDASIYSTLAAQVGVALQNAQLYAEQASTVSQLRELDRLKSSFLANMSHELRTPLNSILGFSDVMLEGLDGPVTETMENDLRLINRNGQHLLSLINDVLDMAKIEAGKMNLNIERFNVHEVLADVVNITAPLAREKALELKLEISSPDLELEADHTRLRQVMINLVGNAIKFTERGGVTISTLRQDGRLRIHVRDTGIGVLPEQTQMIFEEFGQVDTSTTRKTGGTGLGLPISRKLIELHGGQLWVESTGVRGEGSTFIIELPVKREVQRD